MPASTLTATAIAAGVLLAAGPHPAVPKRPQGDVTAALAVPVALAVWRHAGAPRVSLWTDRETPYRRGDAVRVYLSVRESSYLAVLRVDTDGGVRVLYPHDPWGDSWMGGSRVMEITGAGHSSFIVDDYPGLGYLFVVASPTPLAFDPLVRRDQWDYHELAGGRLHGDPYVALTDLARQMAPDGEYDYDIVSYSVERHYDYPRFVCYDCHTGATAAAWDPYGQSCSRYRIVIYDDPYYYPYHANSGRAVVSERPTRPGPRYVFRAARSLNDFVSRARRSADAGSAELTSAEAGAGSTEAASAYRDRSADAARQDKQRDARPAASSTREPELRRRGGEPRRRPNP